MDENPYKAPAEFDRSVNADRVPRFLAHFLTILSAIGAAFFVFMAIGCFSDATWTIWQPPWERGEEGELATAVLLLSAVGFGLCLLTAWTAMRKRKSILAAVLIADAIFLVLLVLL